MQTNVTPLPRPSHAPRGDNRKPLKRERSQARRIKTSAKFAVLLSLASFGAHADEAHDYAQIALGLARSAAATDMDHAAVDQLAGAFILPACGSEDGDDCYWDAHRQGNGVGRSFVSVVGTRLFVGR